VKAPKVAELLLPLLLVAVWTTMMALGTGPVDEAVLSSLYAAHIPPLRAAANLVTLVGEWQSMIALGMIATLWLLWRRRVRAALLFAFVTLSGRLMILLQKEAVGRMRPNSEEHLVVVKSLSFPSAHTANSMILFLSLALFAAPERHRRLAIALALLGAFVVGLSRPMLGVHWPSDVAGGWSFGALWVMLMYEGSRRYAGFSRRPHSRGVQAR
jgi:undecaprenyl-diphosphatase